MAYSKTDELIDARVDELTDDIAALVAIESVNGAPADGAPYGTGPRMALDAAADILRRYGFASRIEGDRVLVAEYGPQPARLGILVHADVVPGGDGWTVTEPFVLRRLNGALYGRGVTDDKGPMAAAIHALRAVRDAREPISGGVRLMIGSSEEIEMDDLRWYMSCHDMPPMVFSPDSDYPVVSAEKGRMRVKISAPVAPGCIVSLRAGSVANAVAATATATLRGVSPDDVSAACDAIEKRTGASFAVGEDDGAVTVSCRGTAAHAAFAWRGVNAASALMECLAQLPLGGAADAIGKICAALPFGDVFGTALGIECADDTASGEFAFAEENSARLTVNLGLAELADGELSVTLDLRLPICADCDAVRAGIERAFDGFAVEVEQAEPPHCVSARSPFVRTLLDIYGEYTGERGEAMATGGLTYVHNVDGGVAFGCEFPGYKYHIHEPDERMPLDDLVLSAKMYAAAITRLCK